MDANFASFPFMLWGMGLVWLGCVLSIAGCVFGREPHRYPIKEITHQ